MERVCFSDCWGLDADLLLMIPRPCYALILVFPHPLPLSSAEESTVEAVTSETRAVWIQQHIRNACGTMAAIHALCHASRHTQIDKNDSSFFLDFVQALAPLTGEERGSFLSNNAPIREAHHLAASLGQSEAS